MYWFLIGAIFGVIHVLVMSQRRHIPLVDYPYLGPLAAAALGALTYGSSLWFVFGGA